MKTIQSLFSISLLAAASSQAAITLLDSDYFTQNINGVADSSHTIASGDFANGGLTLSGASKLVVSIGNEGFSNGANNATTTSVTYGGVSLSQAVQAGSGRAASIWYLDLTGQTFTGSDFVVTYNNSGSGADGMGFGAYVLSGTKTGFSAFASGVGGAGITDSTIELTTLTAGEFVVGAMARNNFDSDGAGGDGVRFSDPLQELYYADLAGASAASGSFTAGAAGAYDLIINDTTNSTAVFVGASFEAIPEPSSALLGGLGLLALFRRRRA